MEVMTLRDINFSAGTLGAFSATAGQVNLSANLNTNIDTGGVLTMATTGAMAVSSAVATYQHAATTFTTASTIFNAGTLFDVNATAITLN